MKLTIKNIGVIKEADIELSGLTVIAGENDSGKSTVGKLMFSITKAIGRYEDELEESKESDIEKAVERIYFSIRIVIFRGNKHEYEQLKKMFHPHYFIDEVNDNGIEAIKSRIEYLKEKNIYNDRIEELFTNLQDVVRRDYDKKSAIKRAFNKVAYSEFKGVISSNKTKTSSIKITEGNNCILNIELHQNHVSEFDLQDDLYFNDSVIIETPMILNFNESIQNSKSLFDSQDKQSRLRSLGRANIAFHVKDLDAKLKNSAYEEGLFLNLKDNQLYEKITGIINGEIKFVKERDEFIYFKGEESHNIINVASGIKSFGILQMLLSANFLDERTLVVLDEPEVHLHPKWQLKYAEIIVLLVENNISVLVTTHSPYMIEALERYSEKYKVGANFYLAEEAMIKSENNNKTLSKTVAKLSEPFSVFDKMDAEKL
ncbi:hypothetical protein MS2017_1440 [Bathymodiolus thermophilus thioautotrophic gill symbiont]|uniref:Endonuclease GajA/Old nuclease/RecF-like AAA domain-containing protein n=1 Tax=Bathymodiolus thermophilus thioautotrophic gill symbiont TaxID=2360 RepID=A0A3G3IN16_9GAMM|nr:AAA family ATPase [Bathymodiolus thermophilus thioautotrophic gill symbiont]AYQ57128.1 hypothetical protein MS2017_1440 [Bathymodiolus thermophilus thioautotrophic gill symbiont]